MIALEFSTVTQIAPVRPKLIILNVPVDVLLDALLSYPQVTLPTDPVLWSFFIFQHNCIPDNTDLYKVCQVALALSPALYASCRAVDGNMKSHPELKGVFKNMKLKIITTIRLFEVLTGFLTYGWLLS